MNEYRDFDQSEELQQIELAERLRKREKGRSRLILLTACSIGAVILIALFLSLNYLFLKVEEVSIVGCSNIDEAEVTAIVEKYAGEPLLFVNGRLIEAQCEKLGTAISGVSVEKRFPNTLVVKITEEKPLFYSGYQVEEGKTYYFVAAKSMKILEIFSSEEQLLEDHPHLTKVRLSQISYCVTGEPLRFLEDQNGEILPQVIEEICNSPFGAELSYIDFSNRFDIRFYGGVTADGSAEPRYEVRLGNRKELSKKLAFADGIIKELPAEFTGMISVEDPANGYANPNK